MEPQVVRVDWFRRDPGGGGTVHREPEQPTTPGAEVTVAYPRIDANPGDEITVTLANGMTLTGPVDHLITEEHGSLRSGVTPAEVTVLALREPGRDDPICIRGDLIILWRLGPPVRQAASGLAVPAAGLPPGLLNGGR